MEEARVVNQERSVLPAQDGSPEKPQSETSIHTKELSAKYQPLGC
jgi:hypothetical protein